ncbi:MAG: Shedu anti-phage system protein SduA domain-containing protein [Flavobacteriaceae bacterium]
MGSEVLGGVSQVQINCKSWQKSAEEIENRELINDRIYTVLPKGILLIGNTSEFKNSLEQLTTFELFRKGLNNIDILTYDELLERARFILGQSKNHNLKSVENKDDDLPF